MTDKEIIEALENIINEKIGCCAEDCAFYDGKVHGCEQTIAKYALDLINRQQSKVENLKVENQSLRSAANSFKMHYEEAQAEIEKLNAENMLTISERNAFRTSFYEVLKQLKTAKSEAIKEFAERLKENYFPSIDSYCTIRNVVLTTDIDNLLKEMVGEL